MPAAQASAGSNAANNPGSAAAAPTTALSEGVSKTQRLSNTTASLPIVYGSIAFYLGKKADELQTHEWTLFLRGPNKEDDHLNTTVISKVVFQLHPSFAQPIRELTEPPYEVTERGWGEFEAQIRIHWKDPTEQTTIVNHTIKLYPPGTPPAGSAKKDMVEQSTEKPVLAENYDEVVFTDPTESFFRSLTQVTALPPGASASEEETASFAINKDALKKSSRSSSGTKHPSSSAWKDHIDAVYSDREDFLALIAAQKYLQEELAGVKQRFALVTDELPVVDQKLLLAQQQKQREAAAAAVRGSTTTNERKRTKKGRSSATSGAPSSKKARTSASGSKSSAAAAGASPKRAAGAGRGQPKSGGKTTSKAGAAKRGNASSTAKK